MIRPRGRLTLASSPGNDRPGLEPFELRWLGIIVREKGKSRAPPAASAAVITAITALLRARSTTTVKSADALRFCRVALTDHLATAAPFTFSDHTTREARLGCCGCLGAAGRHRTLLLPGRACRRSCITVLGLIGKGIRSIREASPSSGRRHGSHGRTTWRWSRRRMRVARGPSDALSGHWRHPYIREPARYERLETLRRSDERVRKEQWRSSNGC